MAKKLTAEQTQSKERLRAAVWHTAGQIVEEECQTLNVSVTPQFIASLADLVFNQTLILGSDLESFARHGNRKLINTDDLRMVCRRNEVLQKVLDQFVQDLRAKREDDSP